MKTFEELFGELTEKALRGDVGSGTVRSLRAGTHEIGKKVVDEASEVWMAAEHEGQWTCWNGVPRMRVSASTTPRCSASL